MSLVHCILREISHRKLNFALSVAAALVAAACVLGMTQVLARFDRDTSQLLAAQQAEVKQRGDLLTDDVRKITKGLGFNILILPEGQDRADVYAEGFGSKTMPEEYVTRLAAAPIVTIDHLLPSLEQKLLWPEQQRTIVLVGIRGEVPRLQGAQKKPLLDPVPPEQIVLGYELHQALRVQPGDELTLLERQFTVAACYEQRGSKDDITAWINLDEAQQLLDKPGQINAIWALECNCNTIDRLAEIRGEIASVLPGTQVIEVATQATARAEARKKAEQLAVQSLAQATADRAALRQRMETLWALAIPLVLLACGVWVGLLAWGNVRDRRAEIGILRAIGLRSSQILSIFLGKAVLAGMAGAALGSLLGLGAGALWQSAAVESPSELLGPSLLVVLAVVLLGTPLLAALASWLPALWAAQQDPATVLSE